MLTLAEMLRGATELHVRDVLFIHGNNRRKSAKTLGISLATLYRMFQRLNITDLPAPLPRSPAKAAVVTPTPAVEPAKLLNIIREELDVNQVYLSRVDHLPVLVEAVNFAREAITYRRSKLLNTIPIRTFIEKFYRTDAMPPTYMGGRQRDNARRSPAAGR
jgi:hypothetical protein